MIFGKLGKYSKHKLEIETDDELDIYKISKYANGRQVSVSVEIEDGRRILALTNAERRMRSFMTSATI